MSPGVPDRRLIAVEGLPGSGYDLLARWIGERPGWYSLTEEILLEEGARRSQPSPLSVLLQRLLDRYEHAQEMVRTDLFREYLVVDHIFETHLLWARALLTEREWTLYQKIAAVITPPPVVHDLVVYIQAPPEDLVAALRAADRSVDPDRWRDLIAAYNRFFFAYDRSPLLVVRTQSSAWLSNDGAREALWERIQNYPGGRTYLGGEADFWEGGHPAG